MASGAVGHSQPDAVAAEAGLVVLLEAWERAVEDVAASVPPAQLRALLVIDRCRAANLNAALNLNALAAALGASASATSRLCDRMEAAGLLSRDRAASRREIELALTDAGIRLAAWVAARRRAALGEVLRQLSRDGRAALLRGLAELATLTARETRATAR